MSKKKYIMVIFVIILVVVPGIVGYYTYTESQKKPQFNVSQLEPLTENARVHVRNIGSKDAHSVEIEIKARDPHSDWHNLFYTKKLEILKAGASQMVNVDALPDKRPLDYDEFKVIVSCEEGVTQEFHISTD